MIRTIRVYGIPAPKGSTRAYVVKGRAITTDASKTTRPWMFAVADAARQVYGSAAPTAGPVAVALTFWMPRPKGHRNAKGIVKASAPPFPVAVRRDDLDKLIRCVLDALTLIAWQDDAQVVLVRAEKLYESDPQQRGVVISVEEIT